LKQMFAILDNDPKRIAYALALPALTDRRLRSWYAEDERFHGSLRAEAEKALSEEARSGATRGASEEYLEVEYALEKKAGTPSAAERANLEILSREQWDDLVGSLAASFGIAAESGPADADSLLLRIPLHQTGGLREEPDRFVSMTLLERKSD